MPLPMRGALKGVQTEAVVVLLILGKCPQVCTGGGEGDTWGWVVLPVKSSVQPNQPPLQP